MATAAVDCLALQISLLISLLLAIISHLFSSVSLDKLSAGSRATWEAQPAYKLHLILWRCIPSTPHSTQNKTFLFTLGTSNFCWENKCKEMKGFKYFVGMPRAQFEARKSLMFQAWKISLAITALSQCSHSAHLILGDATQAKWILYPSKLLTQTPEQTRVRAWRLSCRDKSVKEGRSHKNPPGISCWGKWEQGPGPPGCCRMGWGQGCVDATELVVPQEILSPPAIPCSHPFKSSWSLEPFCCRMPVAPWS